MTPLSSRYLFTHEGTKLYRKRCSRIIKRKKRQRSSPTKPVGGVPTEQREYVPVRVVGYMRMCVKIAVVCPFTIAVTVWLISVSLSMTLNVIYKH